MNDLNITQVKQLLFNNLWHGENRRHAGAETPFLSSVLVQPDYNRPWGLDIAGQWDGIVDLAHAKALGASFVYIKGIDGALPVKYFPENYAAASNARLDQAPYAWLYRDANISAVKQAQATNDLIQKYPPTLPVAIDFESTRYNGIASNPNFSDLRKWVTEFIRLGNPKPLLYSAKYFMDQYGQIPNDLKDMFVGLWAANYGAVHPVLPLGWTGWVLHQFAATGDMKFLAPSSFGTLEVDLNYAATAIKPLPLPVIGEQMLYKVIYPVSYRVTPSTVNNDNLLGGLLVGDVLTGTMIQRDNDAVKQWIHFTSVVHSGGMVQEMDAYCSGYPKYVSELPIVTPPVPGIDSISVTTTDETGTTTESISGTIKKS